MFKFHIVEQIPSRTINLVQKKPIETMGVLFGEFQKLLKRLAFVPLAGGFSDAKHLDNFAANPVNVLTESVFLNVERERWKSS